MKNNKSKYAMASVILVLLVLLGSKNTEIENQKNQFAAGQQVYPVPIPNKLDFAGEAIPLEKFEVKERLDRELLSNTYWQSNTMLMLKRTKKYFAVIDPILEQNGIPKDFRYLAVAESGLQNATSSAGAKGVWQFMASSGKSYGLTINDQVDERYNLEKSTQAACLYLNKAYNKFGSWSLAAASYNRGMSGISRDIAKQMVFDYFDLHLNSETARYMLRILALKTIMENPELYNFHIDQKDYYSATPTMDIMVDASIPNVAEYAVTLGTNYHVLKTLNPWIKGNELEVKTASYIIKAPLAN